MPTPEEIQAYADAIAERYQPERIILFGSYAPGSPQTPHEYSDVDLLVVMEHEGNALRAGMEVRRRVRADGFRPHIVVPEPDELRWRIEQGDWFLREVLDQGTTLYDCGELGCIDSTKVPDRETGRVFTTVEDVNQSALWQF